MSKMGLPYLPRTLVWTKISLDKYSPVYPTYISKKFEHSGKKFAPKFISLWNIYGYNEDTYYQRGLEIEALINDDFK